jgi:hypothetical protein
VDVSGRRERDHSSEDAGEETEAGKPDPQVPRTRKQGRERERLAGFGLHGKLLNNRTLESFLTV